MSPERSLVGARVRSPSYRFPARPGRQWTMSADRCSPKTAREATDLPSWLKQSEMPRTDFPGKIRYPLYLPLTSRRFLRPATADTTRLGVDPSTYGRTQYNRWRYALSSSGNSGALSMYSKKAPNGASSQPGKSCSVAGRGPKSPAGSDRPPSRGCAHKHSCCIPIRCALLDCYAGCHGA
jgi:hypothetical protein